jgi:hypothetical protein
MALLTYAERLKLSQRIEKLARLTVARGATKAEAAMAAQKIRVLRDRLYPRSQGLYVEGWPGEVLCEHRIWYRLGIHKICAECRKTFL